MTDWLNISKRTKIDHHLIIFFFYLTELKNKLLLIRKSICIDEFSHFRVFCSSNSRYYLLHSLPPTIHVTYYCYYYYYYSRCLLLILFSLHLPSINLLASSSSSYSRYFIFQSLLSTTTTLVASSCYYTRFSSNSWFYSCYLLFLLANLLSNLLSPHTTLFLICSAHILYLVKYFVYWLRHRVIDIDRIIKPPLFINFSSQLISRN